MGDLEYEKFVDSLGIILIVLVIFLIMAAIIWPLKELAKGGNDELYRLYQDGRYEKPSLRYWGRKTKRTSRVDVDELKSICENIRTLSSDFEIYNYYEMYSTGTTSYAIDVCGIYIEKVSEMVEILPETDSDKSEWSKYFIKSNRKIAKQKSSVSNEVLMHIIQDTGKDI